MTELLRGNHTLFKTKEKAPLNNEKRIRIPEGAFKAPGDYEIRRIGFDLLGQKTSLDLIKQKFEGNCAEYTTLNAAIIARKIGAAINPGIQDYLDQGRMDLKTVETDLVLPLLACEFEAKTGLQINREDLDNTLDKLQNPYEPLTATNSVLLFRSAFSPKTEAPVPFEEKDIIGHANFEQSMERITCTELTTVFLGKNNHATCYLKLGRQVLYVDPYFNETIISYSNTAQMNENIRSTVRGNSWGIATINDIYMRDC